MKNTSLFTLIGGLVFCLVSYTGFAQSTVRLSYANSNPLEQMGANIRQMHGVSLEYSYQLPRSPFSIGIDLGFSNYGTKKIDDFTVVAEGQMPSTYDLTISNNTCYAYFTTRMNLTRAGFIQPYLSARLGVQEYHTDFTLENPNVNHTTDCPDPVDEGTVLSDVAMAVGFGFGVNVDLGKAFKFDLGKNRLFFNVEANYLAGGSVQYMSLNAPINANSTPQNTDIPGLAPGVRTLNHQYHSGNVYRSAIRMYDIRIGMGFSF
ncbi:hypothetical protein BKI52_25450 [marine bacterium AO1-C]|nr:hypothetical protein BKI52_25450 [marine bacterium AO1-C]